jgi:hypothetical protein
MGAGNVSLMRSSFKSPRRARTLPRLVARVASPPVAILPPIRAALSSRPLRRAWLNTGLAIALGASLAVSTPACMPAAAPALASGERPVTGVPRYDRVFADIHSSLVAVQEARSEEAEARGTLARRLGLLDGAPIDVLGTRLRERTARLAQDGLTLELEFSGIDDVEGMEPHVDANAEAATDQDAADDDAEGDAELGAPPSATLRTPGREPQRRELRLLEALAQAALSGATIYANMSRERRHTEQLLVEVAELEARVDSSFVDAGDREKVRSKLSEAKQFLPQLNAQARELSGSADILISLLDEAANTAPVAPARRRAGSPRDGGPNPLQRPPAKAPPPGGPAAAPFSGPAAAPFSGPAAAPPPRGAPPAPSAPGIQAPVGGAVAPTPPKPAAPLVAPAPPAPAARTPAAPAPATSAASPTP